METSDAAKKALETVGTFREGKLTSEYATMKATGWVAYAVVVVGSILAFAPWIMNVTDGTQAATWVGGILAAVGLASKVLTTLGYMKSRTDVKVADAAVTAAVAEHRNGDE